MSSNGSLAGKTALVTGATGFLGGALARRLVDDGVRVRALVRNPARAASLPAEVEHIPGDLTQPDTLRAAADGCDVVFHCAVSYRGASEQQAVNTDGTRQLAQAAAEAGADRFVYVSSIAAYGYQRRGIITEDTPINLHSDAYGSTKAAGEVAVHEVGEACGLSYAIVRPGMIYGPGAQQWTRNLFRLARLRPMPFPGDGSGSAQPIFRDDVVDMLVTVATHPNAAGQAFNCAPDPTPTWRAWMTEYQRLAGHRDWVAIPPALVRLGLRVGGAVYPRKIRADHVKLFELLIAHYSFSMARARDRLGWTPSVDLATGVDRCAPWLRGEGLL
jgi:nucleoside-diphosphate-sugar epimerase